MTTANPDNWELSDLPTGVSLVGSIALSLSLARELGVFHQIDPTMLAMLSIQDILVNALSFVPMTLFFIVVGQYLRMLEFLPSSGRVSTFFNSSGTPKFDLIAFPVFVLIAFLFYDNWALGATINLLLVYGALKTWAENKSSPNNVWIISLTTYGFAILMMAYLNGASYALAGLNKTEYNYEITLNSDKMVKANVLVSGERYLIIRADQVSVRAIAQNDIKDIRRLGVGEHHALLSVSTIWKWMRSWFSSE